MYYLVVLQVSNAFAAEANTGDLAFREHADENRAGFKGRLELVAMQSCLMFFVWHVWPRLMLFWYILVALKRSQYSAQPTVWFAPGGMGQTYTGTADLLKEQSCYLLDYAMVWSWIFMNMFSPWPSVDARIIVQLLPIFYTCLLVRSRAHRAWLSGIAFFFNPQNRTVFTQKFRDSGNK